MPGPYRIEKTALLDSLDGEDAVIPDAGYGVQCVGLVKTYSKCGATSTWKEGALVKDSPELAKGTAIATFNEDGKYASKPSGNHACFFIEFVGELGFRVLEQHVKPHPELIQKRLIRYQIGEHINPCDDANAYSIIL
jgi:hypothetical protein